MNDAARSIVEAPIESRRDFPRPDFESIDPLSTEITYLTSFHYYQDAFDVARLRANATGSDFGIRKAYALEYCDVGEAHTKIGQRIPKAKFSIVLLLLPKYRSGRELDYQVVEPEIMSDEEMTKRGHLMENMTETKRTREGRSVIVEGVDERGNQVTVRKPASVSDLRIPHLQSVTRGPSSAPDSLWIEPNGTAHQLFYGSHASVVRAACPELAEGAKVPSEINERAYAAGWLMVSWPGGVSSPDACEVLDRSGTGSIPERQMDSWITWCVEKNIRPSTLKVASPGSDRAAIWIGRTQ